MNCELCHLFEMPLFPGKLAAVTDRRYICHESAH